MSDPRDEMQEIYFPAWAKPILLANKVGDVADTQAVPGFSGVLVWSDFVEGVSDFERALRKYKIPFDRRTSEEASNGAAAYYRLLADGAEQFIEEDNMTGMVSASEILDAMALGDDSAAAEICQAAVRGTRFDPNISVMPLKAITEESWHAALAANQAAMTAAPKPRG